MQIIIAGLLLCAFCGGAFGADYHYRFPIKISSTNPRILVDQNDVPFMVAGDSPHGLFANVSTAGAAALIADRAARGMNSLWVNLICIRPVEGAKRRQSCGRH